MTTVDVKKSNGAPLILTQPKVRPIRVNFGSELISKKASLAFEKGDQFIRVLFLIGFTIDLLVEAYLIWKIFRFDEQGG